MRNIIVTGGALGIGKIPSLELLKNGYSVSIFEVDEEAMEEFNSDIKSERLAFFKTDVANEESAKQSTESALKKFGNISGLINNAKGK